ncbi:MAG: porin family protein [Bacteroidales bacterium]|nr:porin family protein [Bacteroidales bacterium]
MKKIIALIACLIAFTYATETYAQIFGVKAGLNMSTMLAKDDDDTYSDDLKSLLGFHIGATAELPFGDMFAFEPGLLISTKGYKVDSDSYEGTLSLMYVEVPLNAKAYLEVGGIKLYGTAGPYLGFGVTGKFKSDDDDESVEWGSDEDESDFKRLDFGLNIGAGAQFGPIEAGLTYGLGLANISPSSGNGYKENNRVFGISVAYKLGMD